MQTDLLKQNTAAKLLKSNSEKINSLTKKLDNNIPQNTNNLLKDTKNKFLINLEEVNRLKIQSNYIGIGMFSLFGLLFLYLTYGNYIAYIKSNNQTRNKNHT